MRRIIESIIAGLVVTVSLKALEGYGGIDIMKSIYQTFIVGLWPIWIGLLIASLCWIVMDYIKLRRFNKKLEKWIGLFSSRNRYSDLKGKIKYYIREERP